MPNGLMDRFCELAGGPDHAKLVYVPCEEADDVSPNQSIVEAWKKRGIQNATMLHTKDRNKANEDDEFLKPLREATGIWFGGGRQWNFADSYYGTTAHRLMKEVLQRGGVIGGSSAGASIQARYLARATPIENFNIMAPGYERGGLGFIDGVAIDQHFTQRGRQRDMTQLVNRYPQLLGIGIDETTAITVTGSKATVSGKGKVYFYDRLQPVYPDRPDYIALESGQSFDLVTRREITAETSPITGK
jgi:cyanophycinase